MALDRSEVSRLTESALDDLFEKLDTKRGDQAPSEVAQMLDQDNWGLGDDFREWFEKGDDPWS